VTPLDAAWLGLGLVWAEVTAHSLCNALTLWAGWLGIHDLPDDLEVQMVLDQLTGRSDA
jgi:hypothetical protein